MSPAAHDVHNDLQVESNTDVVAFPAEPFAMRADAMNSQDNNVPDDVWPSDDFEFMKIMECKMIGKHNKTEKQKKHMPSSSKDVYCLQQQQTSFTTADGRVQSRGLPVRIGHAALSLMTMMMLHAQTELQSLLRVGDQCDTWEMFCAPESWLTQACEAHG